MTQRRGRERHAHQPCRQRRAGTKLVGAEGTLEKADPKLGSIRENTRKRVLLEVHAVLDGGLGCL